MRLAGVIAAMALAATAYAQQRMENAQHGFTIEIPEGWHALPEDFLTERSRAASTPEQRVTYVAGFQEQAFNDGLVFPYVLVQSIPYRDFGLDRAPTPAEMNAIVESMFNSDVSSAFSEDLDARIEGVPSVELESFNAATGTYVYDLQLVTDTAGAIRGRAYGYFGRRALIQPIFFSLEAEWEAREVAAEKVLQSLTFLQGYEYESDSIDVVEIYEVDFEPDTNWPLLTGGTLVVLLVLALMYVVMRRMDRR